MQLLFVNSKSAQVATMSTLLYSVLCNSSYTIFPSYFPRIKKMNNHERDSRRAEMFGDYSVLCTSLVVVTDLLPACAVTSSCWK